MPDAVESIAPVRVPGPVLAMSLLTDFAVGIDGKPQGLTVAEFDRAWRARRYDGAAPKDVLYQLRDEGLVLQIPTKRRCAVLGVWRHAWATAGVVAKDLPCS